MTYARDVGSWTAAGLLLLGVIACASCATRMIDLPARLEPLPEPTGEHADLLRPIYYRPPPHARSVEVLRGEIIPYIEEGPGEVVHESEIDVMEIGRGTFSSDALADYEIDLMQRAVAATRAQVRELERQRLHAHDQNTIALQREKALWEALDELDSGQPWWAWLGEGLAAGVVVGVILGALP
jgi:ElaB/YqjD/DUF883 family membrane-anchored ribosome-binding protein